MNLPFVLLPTLATAVGSYTGSEAHKAIARARALDPDLHMANLKDRIGPFHPEDFAR
jgi:hypothetical protein